MYQVKVVGMDILSGLSVAASNIKNELSLYLLCCICSLSLWLKDGLRKKDYAQVKE